jgi:dTDP-4-dehydrorhamnose reductase
MELKDAVGKNDRLTKRRIPGMEKVLVLGGSGLVGRAIMSEMNQSQDFQMYATYYENPAHLNQDRHFKFNLENPKHISSILDTIKPQKIISCLRGDFTKQLIVHTHIAEHLKKSGGRLYYFSTTNVFDHDLSRPHDEDDQPNSCTDYGQFKIACEKGMIEILQERVCILRIPQVWGKDSPRMKQLVNLLDHNEAVTIYPKLLCNTNTDSMIAKQLCYIIENNLTGIFHLTAEDVVYHNEFFTELIAGLGYQNPLMQENVEEEGYFALFSNRMKEFPERLRINNKSVIDFLIQS